MAGKTPLAEIINWMSIVEQRTAALRRGLGQIAGTPRIDRLERLQSDHRRILLEVIAVFWSHDPSERATLLPAYLSVLVTLKIVCDDIFIETLEEGIQPKNRNDPRSNDARLKAIEKIYRETIEDWIVGSPLLDPTSHKNNRALIPKISNLITQPFLRNLADLDQPDFSGTPTGRAAVKAAAKSELQRIRADSKASTRLSASADHLLGALFLLAQIELHLRWENDQTLQSDVHSWYEAAIRPVNVMANDILGIFDEAIREAIFAADDALTERLVTARHLLVNSMATRYSLRRLETRLLLSFFEKQNSTGRFGYQHIAIGVNRAEETLFSYVGRPTPDVKDLAGIRSIGDIRADEAALVNQEVTAFGLANSAGTMLTDELTKATVGVDAPRAMRFLIIRGSDRRVIVRGRLTGAGTTLAITATGPTAMIIPHSEGYRALVGFPLRFAQTDGRGNLVLEPSWRRTTDGLQRAAVRELREDEEGVFSVPQTLSGQRELVTDLLRNADVRKQFATSLAKTKDLDLQDTEVRVKIWSIFFKEIVKDGNRNAMRVMGAFLKSYFAHFTRHTYYNLRDSGKSYLDSQWPTDLTNRKLHDCGVYAVQAAYDLYRAVSGTPGITLEFRFLTFLNHLCLIVFFDDMAFLVNNATVYPPEKMNPQGGSTTNDKVAAAFGWGGVAFTTVYDVSYTMFLAVLPQISLDTNHSDPAFRKAIFKLFLDSLGWGISNDPTIAANYFKDIELFNTQSKTLAGMLPLLQSAKVTPKDWDVATTIALDLYTRGESMTEFKNFVFFNRDFTKNNPIPAVGFALDRDVARAGAKTLPMYELGDLLAQRKNTQRLTADQDRLVNKKRGFDHAVELTDNFRKQIAAAAKP